MLTITCWRACFAHSLLPVCFEDEEMERAWALDLVLLLWVFGLGFDENWLLLDSP